MSSTKLFFVLIQAGLVLLKIAKIITFSWWIVLSPAIVYFLFGVILLAIYGIIKVLESKYKPEPKYKPESAWQNKMKEVQEREENIKKHQSKK